MANRFHGLLCLVPVIGLAAGPQPLSLQAPGPRRLPAQAGARVKDLAAGRFLVARRDLPDPNFAETVILLVQYDEDGVMGLVINRRTKLPLSRVLEDLKEAKGRSELAHWGGPVGTGAIALLRGRFKTEDARLVFADVHLVTSKALLEKSLAGATEASALRVYLGYSGWAAGQLEFEMELGTWHVLRGDPAMVFDADPQTVWSRLIRRSEMRIAQAR